MENDLDIALHIEEVNTLEQVLQVDFEASVEMPTGKMLDLQSPPTAQEEVHRPPFRKMFQPSEKVELNGLLDVRRWTWKLLENKIQRGCERIHSSPGCRLS